MERLREFRIYQKPELYSNTERTGTKISEIKKKNLKTAIKSFESHRFIWVGRLTANKQHFNLGLKHSKEIDV